MKKYFKFGDLIMKMREYVCNNGVYCLSDTIIDLSTLAEIQQIAKVNRTTETRIWGVRQNGTILCNDIPEVEDFLKYFKNEEKIFFKIECNGAIFTIEDITLSVIDHFNEKRI